MKFIQAIKLVLKEGTTFDLYFLDGKVKRYDILSLADKYPPLNKLTNRKLFLKGKLFGWGGVIWNDELDVGCETVYEEGIDVTDEYDDVDIAVFGYAIRDRRFELHLSQEELAERIGIDQSDLSKAENGSVNLTYKTMKKITEGLGCKLILDIKRKR